MAKKKESKSRVIGKDRKVIRRVLDEDEQGKHRGLVARSYETQREVEEDFQAFSKYAQPRIRRAFDPSFNADELQGEAELTYEQARALNDDLDARRQLKGAAVGQLKAERRLSLDAAVNGYAYAVIDCELVADDEKLEVTYVDTKTGEEVDRRAMTDAERQLALSGVGDQPPPSGKGAPSTAH